MTCSVEGSCNILTIDTIFNRKLWWVWVTFVWGVQLEQPGRRKPQCTLQGHILKVEDDKLKDVRQLSNILLTYVPFQVCVTCSSNFFKAFSRHLHSCGGHWSWLWPRFCVAHSHPSKFPWNPKCWLVLPDMEGKWFLVKISEIGLFCDYIR